MKRIALTTLVTLGFAAAALAQPGQPGSRSQPADPDAPRAVPADPAVPANRANPATPAPPGGDRTDQVSFEDADKNADGFVNSEEGNMIAGFDFSRADTNEDGTLSRQEYVAAMATSTPRGDGVPGPRSGDRTEQVAFEAADKDRNGSIDADEAEDIDGFNFTSADVDDNELVSREEYQSVMRNSQPRG
jgi:hypothetical protein